MCRLALLINLMNRRPLGHLSALHNVRYTTRNWGKVKRRAKAWRFTYVYKNLARYLLLLEWKSDVSKECLSFGLRLRGRNDSDR